MLELELFTDSLRIIFDHTAPSQEAARALMGLCQGKRRVSYPPLVYLRRLERLTIISVSWTAIHPAVCSHTSLLSCHRLTVRHQTTFLVSIYGESCWGVCGCLSCVPASKSLVVLFLVSCAHFQCLIGPGLTSLMTSSQDFQWCI